MDNAAICKVVKHIDEKTNTLSIFAPKIDCQCTLEPRQFSERHTYRKKILKQQTISFCFSPFRVLSNIPLVTVWIVIFSPNYRLHVL